MKQWKEWADHWWGCHMCKEASKQRSTDLMRLCRKGRRLYKRVPESVLIEQRNKQGIA